MNDYFKEIANMKFTIADMDEIIQERKIVEKMINYLHSHILQSYAKLGKRNNVTIAEWTIKLIIVWRKAIDDEEQRTIGQGHLETSFLVYFRKHLR